MATKINLTYCGMNGTGETVKLAKQDAARKLERLVEEAGRLHVLKVANCHALLWRDRYGWTYKVFETVSFPAETGRIFGCTGYDDFEDAKAYALKHLAQTAWSFDVPNDAEFVERIVGLSHSAKRDLVGYFAWQRAYRAARQAGHDDDAARRVAGGLPII